MYEGNERLSELYEYDILDTGQEEEFDNLAKLASGICDVPIAQINFIDKNRQWTKASVGWEARELPLTQSFCNHTIREEEQIMIVSDTMEDDRFRDNPLVRNQPGIRFYAGVALKGERGHNLGSLCVIDNEPRKLTEDQIENLRILAAEVVSRLNLRRSHRRLNDLIINNLPVNFFLYDENLNMVRWNDNLKRSTGYSNEEIRKLDPLQYFREEDRETIESMIQKVFEEGKASVESSLKGKDGSVTPYIFSASRVTLGDSIYMIGTGQDITEQKKTQRMLQSSLEEKDVMLAEIHHRVKNNLAVISGLIQMELMETEFSGIGRDRMEYTHLRILSMSKIHEVMYQSDNFTDISMLKVFPEIIRVVKEQYENISDNLHFHHELEDVTLNINQAIPCGLILNELLIDLCRHASKEAMGQTHTVTTTIRQSNDRVAISVDAPFLSPPDSRVASTESEWGDKQRLRGIPLVRQLCHQLEGELKTEESGGTQFTVVFEKQDMRGAGSTLRLSGS